MEDLTSVDKENWTKETEGIEQFYGELGSRVPKELYSELAKLKANLK
ncbi:MAG: phosphoenolpyruvate carboxykinase (GTP) [Clostridia bacterium]|nr:phosphoenolpyruvate carboxykinase (GTP) [Clostridia bacterium]